jgi:uncharacterized protein (TIGR02001 family)
MKRSILALAVAIAAPMVPAIAHADVAFNIGAVTDYRYRGISQTRLQPAIQGGVDFTAGGFYLGAWASNIKWISDFGGDAEIEVDLYGGFKGELAKDLTFDVGVLTYQYPSNGLTPSADTTEIYAALTFGPLTVKYSRSVSDTFANADSDASYYFDVSAGFDVSGITVTPHVGYQRISGPFKSPGSYTDYSLTVAKDFSGVLLSLAVVGTNADKAFYSSPVNGKELGKPGVVVGAKYSF